MSEKITGENAEALAKKLLSFAGAILDKSDDELASLIFKDDGVVNEKFVSDLTELNSQHLESIGSKHKGKFDEGHKAGYKEAYIKLEKQFNTDYEYEGDGPITDRFKTVLNRDIAKALEGSGKEELTDVEIMKRKVYTDLQELRETDRVEHNKALEEKEKYYSSLQTKSQVKDILLTRVRGLNPVYNDDKVRATNQEHALIKDLMDYNWGVKDKELILLDKDDVQAIDSQHHPIKATDVIEKVVLSLYSLDASGNNNPPASGGGSQGGKPTDIKGIDTSDKLMKAMQEATQENYNAQSIKNKEKREEALKETQDRIDKLRAHGKELNLTK